MNTSSEIKRFFENVKECFDKGDKFENYTDEFLYACKAFAYESIYQKDSYLHERHSLNFIKSDKYEIDLAVDDSSPESPFSPTVYCNGEVSQNDYEMAYRADNPYYALATAKIAIVNYLKPKDLITVDVNEFVKSINYDLQRCDEDVVSVITEIESAKENFPTLNEYNLLKKAVLNADVNKIADNFIKTLKDAGRSNNDIRLFIDGVKSSTLINLKFREKTDSQEILKELQPSAR